MDKKPRDKEIKAAIDRQMQMLESGGMLRTGKKRNPIKDAPIALTADKVVAARDRYLGEKNLHNWKISRFMIPNTTPFEYDYEKDGIINTKEYKAMNPETVKKN